MAETHAEDQWDALKDELRSLYLERGMALPAVSRLMEERHGFSARKNQYEKHFKRWKWSKNRSPEQWRQMDNVRRDRQVQGRDSEFYDRGCRIPQQQLDRNTRRYRHLGNYHQAPAPGLPSGITVHTPPLELEWEEETLLISNQTSPPENSQQLMFDLPFRSFENGFQHELGQTGLRHQAQLNSPKRLLTVDPRLLIQGFLPSLLSSNILPEQISSSNNLRLMDSSAENEPTPGLSVAAHVNFEILDSILPPTFLEAPLYIGDPNCRLLSTPQLRRILFSLSNNFAGTGILTFGDSMRLLGRETGDSLYRFIRGASDYTSKSIARAAFRCAIESGDPGVVDLILSQNIAHVNSNDEVCIFGGNKYTPIELASRLRYEKVIKVLLNHNADIRKTFERRDDFYPTPTGALECALSGNDPKVDSKLSPSIFKILHDSGGTVRVEYVQHLIDKRNSCFIVDIISTHIREEDGGVIRGTILPPILRTLEEQACMEIIEELICVGADLNHRISNRIFAKCRSLIDSAAARGSVRMVQKLLQRGARITRDTLQYAINSGNIHLIEILLDEGADINSIGSEGLTPFAASVRLKSPDVRNLIIDRGGMSCVAGKRFAATLLAACEAWDIELIEYLLKMDDATDAKTLGMVLLHAVKNEDEEFAKRLFDLGADLDVAYRCDAKYCGPPLHEALKRRNAYLTHMLLQASIESLTNHTISNLRQDFDHSAVLWGDRSIIEALLFAGLYFDYYSLAIAVREKNRELVEILMDSGVHNYERHPQSSALAMAALNGDIDMARYLIDRGIDSHDSTALESCVLSNWEMFEFLLDEHVKRYPFGRKGYGSATLRRMVESGQEHAVKIMLEKGLDANEFTCFSDWTYLSAFGAAIMKDQPQRKRFIEIFLHAGCGPNDIVSSIDLDSGINALCDRLHSSTKLTTLLATVSTRDVSVAKLLLQYGANVNFPASGPVKRTPLQRSVEIGSLEMVKLLLKHGAEVNAPPARYGGGTALQLAAIGGYIGIAWELMTKGADVNAKASVLNGRTALEGASEHGRLDMVAVLLKAGAADNGKDHAQLKRAMEFAKENGHFHICEFLIADQPLMEENEFINYEGEGALVEE